MKTFVSESDKEGIFLEVTRHLILYAMSVHASRMSTEVRMTRKEKNDK